MQHYQSPYGQPQQPQTGPNGMPQIQVGQTPGLPYHPPEQLMPQIPGGRANHTRLRQVLGLVMWSLEGLANKEPHIQNLYLMCSNAGRGYGGPLFVELVARSFYYVYDVETNGRNQGKAIDNEIINGCVSWVVNTIGYIEAANDPNLLSFIQSVPEWAEAANKFVTAWNDVRQRIDFAKAALMNDEQMAGGGGPGYGYPNQQYGAPPAHGYHGGQPGGYGGHAAPGYGPAPNYHGGYQPTPPNYTNGAGYNNPGYNNNYGGGYGPANNAPGMTPIAGAPGSPVAGNPASAYGNAADSLGLSDTRYDDDMSVFQSSESDSQ